MGATVSLVQNQTGKTTKNRSPRPSLENPGSYRLQSFYFTALTAVKIATAQFSVNSQLNFFGKGIQPLATPVNCPALPQQHEAFIRSNWRRRRGFGNHAMPAQKTTNIWLSGLKCREFWGILQGSGRRNNTITSAPPPAECPVAVRADWAGSQECKRPRE
jgi:hypothetical protein